MWNIIKQNITIETCGQVTEVTHREFLQVMELFSELTHKLLHTAAHVLKFIELDARYKRVSFIE